MNVEVRAEMDATVWQVLVEVGQQVGAGDELIILESMKMEIPVEAPSAGTVASIAFVEGDAVKRDDLIVTLS